MIKLLYHTLHWWALMEHLRDSQWYRPTSGIGRRASIHAIAFIRML